ncbi:MAG: AraC family transcriptional regulator [Gemmatimonadaceae bacterium]|nr:AraC family transcriptional regulator [Gemmatimonadaceae bacterium]
MSIALHNAVVLENANGVIARELARLLHGWAHVRLLTSHDHAAEAPAYIYAERCGDSAAPFDVSTSSGSPLPAAASFALYAHGEWISTTAHGGAPRLVISRPKDRLALLAGLARSFQNPKHSGTRNPAVHELHRDVADVLIGYDLRATEAQFATRLGVNPSTLGRWFKSVGPLTFGRLSLWLRMTAVVDRLTVHQQTVEAATHALGFSATSNVQRTFRTLCGFSIGEVKTPLGRRRFAQQLEAAMYGRASRAR